MKNATSTLTRSTVQEATLISTRSTWPNDHTNKRKVWKIQKNVIRSNCANPNILGTNKTFFFAKITNVSEQKILNTKLVLKSDHFAFRFCEACERLPIYGQAYPQWFAYQRATILFATAWQRSKLNRVMWKHHLTRFPSLFSVKRAETDHRISRAHCAG